MLPRVTSSHKLENAIASALGRKMETLANVVSLRNEVEDRVREVLWMRSGEADADFRIDLRDLVQQICEAHPTCKKIDAGIDQNFSKNDNFLTNFGLVDGFEARSDLCCRLRGMQCVH